MKRQQLSTAQIRLSIDDEINGAYSLRDSQKALDQLGQLIENGQSIDYHSISHLMHVLSDKISDQIGRIDNLSKQLNCGRDNRR